LAIENYSTTHTLAFEGIFAYKFAVGQKPFSCFASVKRMELGPQGNAEAQASESWLGNFTCAHGRGQKRDCFIFTSFDKNFIEIPGSIFSKKFKRLP